MDAYNPTPNEIAEACRKIQATWDEQEFKRRAGVVASQTSRWLPPGPLRILLSDLDLNPTHNFSTKSI